MCWVNVYPFPLESFKLFSNLYRAIGVRLAQIAGVWVTVGDAVKVAVGLALNVCVNVLVGEAVKVGVTVGVAVGNVGVEATNSINPIPKYGFPPVADCDTVFVPASKVAPLLSVAIIAG